MRQHLADSWTRPLAFVCASVFFLAAGLSAAPAPAPEVANAVANNNRDAVRALLQSRADVNAPQADGTTALHWAARWNDLETADRLIHAGADPKVANRDGATPMFLATQNGSAAMIEKF